MTEIKLNESKPDDIMKTLEPTQGETPKVQLTEKKTSLTIDEANAKINELQESWKKKLDAHNTKHAYFEVVLAELNKLYTKPDSDEEISRCRAKLINAADLRYKGLLDSYQTLHLLLRLSTELKNQHIESLSNVKEI